MIVESWYIQWCSDHINLNNNDKSSENAEKELRISDVIHSDSKQMGIDARWEITKRLREECRKTYGEPMGIDAEEVVMETLRKIVF